MEHFKEGQYDDDLTQGSYDDDLTSDIEEYDEDFDTGDVDLFGYTDDEDSVLGRLKSIILSIEWEITDDILRQFNEELLDLKNIWAGNKVNLIYVQALEKISRYIYKEKSSAHPNAIKLLLTFYTNLEKIVSDDTMSELQQKKMLRTDINLFEKLKKQISESADPATPPTPKTKKISPPKEEPTPKPAPVSSDALIDSTPDAAGEPGQEDPLLNLKAIVYGIDWEITERDLKNLSREVKRLEKQYSNSKAKQIFLQGIGSLGAYINLKRSDAHADAFKLLHSFYMGLETVVRNNLSGQAEKDVLLPEVEKFNNFKGLIADTISPEKTQSKIAAADEEEESYEDTEIKPAFADVADDVRGYQAEDEDESPAADVADSEEVDEYFDSEEPVSPPSEADSALASEMESRLEGMFDEPSEEAVHQLDKDRALKGVDVETEDDDDSDEEPLPEHDGELAPALAAEDVFLKEESPAVLAEKEDDLIEEDNVPDEPEIVSKEVPGVDVEHEADDDSDEEPLPFDGDEYAPALSSDDADVSARKEKTAEEPSDIDSRLDDFFGESTEDQTFEAETVEQEETVEEPEAVEDVEKSAMDDLEPEEEKIDDSEPVKVVDSEIDGRIDDFFSDEAAEREQEVTEDPIKGVEVETPDDDDSDEDPLPLDGDELAPALSVEEEREEKDDLDSIATLSETDAEDSGEIETTEVFADDQPSKEFTDDDASEDVPVEDETGDVEARFDELFGDADDQEEEIAKETKPEDIEETVFSDIHEDESEVAQALDGVDVETPEDDDSDEEPLPFEDGELAPALGGDDLADQHADLSFTDESQERETEERFDDIFGTSEEDADRTSASKEDELRFDDEHDQEGAAERDALFSEEELVAEEEQDDEGTMDVAPEGVTDYEEAGFEEIWDEDIEDIPEEMLAADSETVPEGQQAKDKDEILAYFADDMQEDSEEDIPEMEADELATVIDDAESSAPDMDSPGYASPDELLQQFDETRDEKEDISAYRGDEEDIPEMEVDDLATVIDEGSGITAAGAVPSGYPSTDELLRQFGEVAGEEQADVDAIGTEEEEVVFEAVDESLEPLTDDERSYEDDDTFGITLLDDGEYGGKTVEESSAVEDEEDDLEAVTAIQATDDPRSAAYVKPQVEIPVQESLSGMRNCIASLGLEIDTDILDSMNTEIEKLRHTWMDKPAEKTFIQLLSTIAGHINRYRYEADQEANKLLLSVFDKLELTATGQADSAEIQEALLNETSKVLQWQARLIDRVPATAGSVELASMAEGTASMGGQEDKTMLGEAGLDEEYNTHLEDMSRQVDEIGNDMLMQKMSTIMKTELDQLKAAFQSELMELRKEILKGGKDS